MTISFSDLYTPRTLAEIKAYLLSIFTPATAWGLLDPTPRWIEMVTRAVDQFVSIPLAQAVRMMFLDLATDPGDPGDLSADQTPRPGTLSALGSSWYGVERGGQTYATGFVTLTNIGTTPATLKPFDLSFERSTTGADGGQPTYRNTADPSIYTGIGGTVTIAPSGTLVIPIQAEQLGTYADAAGSSIGVVTQSFGDLSGNNASPVLGADREDPDVYRARCRIAAAGLAPGGPGEAYKLAANTARDGSTLRRFDGSGNVGITDSYVSADSATGLVTVYFRTKAGVPDDIDVSSANSNITGISLGVITDPRGVLPDAVTIGPTTSDPNTLGPGGAAAIATNVKLIGATKIRSRAGGLTGDALVAAVHAAIDNHLEDTFGAYPIGGLDQVAGAGVLYTQDHEADIRDSYAGLYDTRLTTPSESGGTVLPLGHVAVRVSLPAITGAVNNGSGAIKLTATGHGLSGGETVQVYGVKGTVEANLIWTVSVPDANHVTLAGSSFANAYISGGRMSLLQVVVISGGA